MRRSSTAIVPAVVLVLLGAAGCGVSSPAGGGAGATAVNGGTRQDGSRDTLVAAYPTIPPAKGCAAVAPNASSPPGGDSAVGSKVVVSVGLSGVKRSEDGGATWTTVKVSDDDEHLTATSVVAAPDGSVLFGSLAGGMYQSMDRGLTWSRVRYPGGLTDAPLDGLARGPAPVIVGVGLGGAALQTENNGTKWNDYLVNTKYKLAGIATNSKGTFVAVGNGAFVSGKCGAGFDKAFDTWTHDDLTSVTYSNDAGFLAAGPGIVMRSTDDGRTWTITHDRSPDVRWNSIAASKKVAIVVGGPKRGTGCQALRSTDGGTSWSELSLPCKKELTVVATDGGDVFLVESQDDQMYRSTDGGITWTSFPIPVRATSFAFVPS